MTALYATTLAVGVIGLLVWAWASVAADADVAKWFDPDRRYGSRGRLAVAAPFGFGMAGMSSSFAGWPAAGALVAAVVGAVAMAALAVVLGPGTRS